MAAKIPTYEQRGQVGALPGTPRATAPTALGQALQDAGTIGRNFVADEQRRMEHGEREAERRAAVLRERDDRRATLDATLAVDEARRTLTARAIELQAETTGDPEGYVERLDKEIVAYQDKLLPLHPNERANDSLRAHLSGLRTTMVTQGINWQAQRAVEFDATRTDGMVKSLSRDLAVDPSRYAAYVALTDEAIGAMRATPAVREKMREARDKQFHVVLRATDTLRRPFDVYRATSEALNLPTDLNLGVDEPAPTSPAASSAPVTGPGSNARGVRNANPGNVRGGAEPWQGQTGVDDKGFAVFDRPESGIRAAAKNLLTYGEKHGLTTVEGIIGRWAPPAENDTRNYIKAVSSALGVKPGDKLDLRDPEVLAALMTAIIRHENGVVPYSAAQVQAGVNAALGKSTGAPGPNVVASASTVTIADLPTGADHERKKTGVPWIDAMPVDELLRARAEAHNELARQQTAARAGVNTRERDDYAAAADGKAAPQPVTNREFVAAYGPVEGTRRAYEYQQTQTLATDIKAMQGMPLAQGNAMVQVSDPAAGAGYAAADQRQKARAQAWQAEVKKREDDGAAYVIKTAPNVAAAAAAVFAPNAAGVPRWVDPATPPAERNAAMRAYLTQSQAEQQRLGIRNVALLPAEAEGYIVRAAQQAAGSGDRMAANIAGLAQTFGEYWPAVYRQVVGGKNGTSVPDSFVVIPGIPASRPAAREEVARLDKVKVDDLKKMVPDGAPKDIDAGLQTALAPWFASIMPTAQNTQTAKAVRSVAEKVALAHVAAGGKVADAVAKAADTVIGHYDFRAAHSTRTYAVPKDQDPGAVVQGLGIAVSKLEGLNLPAPPDLTGSRDPAEASVEWTRMVRARPQWVTNGDETGLLLYTAGADGRARPVMGMGGKQVEYLFSDLRTLVADQAGDTAARAATALTAPGQQPTRRSALERDRAAMRERAMAQEAQGRR